MILTPHLIAEHRRCDELFTLLEQAVRAQDWPHAASCAADFARETLAHFSMEEGVLFPALEQASGLRGGPTMVMRFEHEQMRELLEEMDQAIRNKDSQSALGCFDTLLVLMQQHNLKEENILYPMCDSQIADATALLQEISHVTA